ncbi:MAG TPA: hypothetical protein VJI12_04670 [archaeon]|nr:hypothetical protein [archaeon]
MPAQFSYKPRIRSHRLVHTHLVHPETGETAVVSSMRREGYDSDCYEIERETMIFLPENMGDPLVEIHNSAGLYQQHSNAVCKLLALGYRKELIRVSIQTDGPNAELIAFEKRYLNHYSSKLHLH